VKYGLVSGIFRSRPLKGVRLESRLSESRELELPGEKEGQKNPWVPTSFDRFYLSCYSSVRPRQ